MNRATAQRRMAYPYPVLLVEDDPDVSGALAEILREEGYVVATAADGLEALRLLPMLPRPCVVVLDGLMPRLDGAGLLERLQEGQGLAGLSVVVTTVSDARIRDPKVSLVLRKPYDVGELLRALDVHCRPQPR